MNTTNLHTLPVLPLKGMVLFVNVDHTVVVGRPRSLAAVTQAAASEDKSILVVAQRNPDTRDPGSDELYEVATRAYIQRMERHADDVVSLVLHGGERARIHRIVTDKPWLEAEYEVLPWPAGSSEATEALYRDILSKTRELDRLGSEDWPKGLVDHLLKALKDPLEQAYAIASLLKLEVAQQQQIH